MYDSWYSLQYRQYNDSFNSEWEIFGIKAKPASDLLGPREKLSAQAVFGWLESEQRRSIQSAAGENFHSGFCLL
jgi:hypothetical protein